MTRKERHSPGAVSAMGPGQSAVSGALGDLELLDRGACGEGWGQCGGFEHFNKIPNSLSPSSQTPKPLISTTSQVCGTEPAAAGCGTLCLAPSGHSVHTGQM